MFVPDGKEQLFLAFRMEARDSIDKIIESRALATNASSVNECIGSIAAIQALIALKTELSTAVNGHDRSASASQVAKQPNRTSRSSA